MPTARLGVGTPVTDPVKFLAELATKLAALDDQRPLTWRMCEAARLVLGGTGAAMTLGYTSGHRVTVCTTDEVAARLEDLQDVLGEGPGPAAYDGGELEAVVLDEDAARRWPTFTGDAQEAFGRLAIYAIPMRSKAQVLGVLTMYRPDAEPLDQDLETAQFVSDALGAALLRDPQAHESADVVAGGPWASRAPIHQATGIVMSQVSVSPEDALALMRAHAYAHDLNLYELAAEIIERRVDFSSPHMSGD